MDVGDSVEILEEYGEWLRGTCPRKPRVVGIFPRSYIHIKDSAKSDPVVTECTQVLREWSEIWKKYYVVSIISTVVMHLTLLTIDIFIAHRKGRRTNLHT